MACARITLFGVVKEFRRPSVTVVAVGDVDVVVVVVVVVVGAVGAVGAADVM